MKKFRRSEDEIGIEKRPGETRNGDRSQSSGGKESQKGQKLQNVFPQKEKGEGEKENRGE